MRVIGIESSCDETAVAVFDSRAGPAGASAPQPGCNASSLRGGGAGTRLPGPCPAPASAGAGGLGGCRARTAIRSTGSPIRQVPGLIGALLVGAGFARSLAYAWGRPAVGIHHLEGHLLAPLLEPNRRPFRFWPCWSRAATPSLSTSRRSAATAFLANRSTMPPEKPSTRLPNCWVFPIRAARRSRTSHESGRRGAIHVPAPDARSSRPRFQFQWLEDRRPSSLARPRPGRAGPR